MVNQRYRKRFTPRAGRKNRYACQAVSVGYTFTNNSQSKFSCDIVTASTVFGSRKAKNFRISLTLLGQGSQIAYWAILFVPEAFNLTDLHTCPGQNTMETLYAPEQNIIASGVIIPNQVISDYSPLARLVQGGDRIIFVIQVLALPAQAIVLSGVISYVMCYA